MNIKNSKETILNQALAIFGRLGFHKTTMADIANASKRGRRTIYTYFKNKEEVYDAVIEREIDKVIEEIQIRLDNQQQIKDKLLIYIESRLFRIIELAKRYDALHIAYINNYKWIDKIRASLDKKEMEIIKQILHEGKAQNIFEINDVKAKTENIAFILRGMEFILIKENNQNTTTQQIKDLQHIILNGITHH